MKLIRKLSPITNLVCRTTPLEDVDVNFVRTPRKLMAVTDKYLIIKPLGEIIDHTNGKRDDIYGSYALERDIWDDGNWEEVTEKLLIVTEITVSNSFPLTFEVADRYCVWCGGKLRYILHNNYYCESCETGFNIKEE